MNESLLGECYIFDIDGTLAIRGDRGIFDWKNVIIDNVNEHVKLINLCVASYFQAIYLSNPKIFIFSGRDEICRDETIAWLRMHNVYYNRLCMRKHNDNRKDTIVKEEMYEQFVKDKYKVLGVFDDRPSVCRMWRSLGLPVFQVGDPHIEF